MGYVGPLVRVFLDYPRARGNLTLHSIDLLDALALDLGHADAGPFDLAFDFVEPRGVLEPTKAARQVLFLFEDLHAQLDHVNAAALFDSRMVALLSPEERAVLEAPDFRRRGLPLEVLRQYDVIATPLPEIYEPLARALEGTKTRLVRCPLSVPGDVFFRRAFCRRYMDVVTYGRVNPWYPLRLKIVRELGELHYADWYFFRAQYPSVDVLRSEERFRGHKEQLAGLLQHTKIVVTDGSVENVPLSKHFEVMACGCLLLCPIPRGGEHLGFVHGETMADLDPSAPVREQIEYWLAHPEKRAAIGYQAAELVAQRHTSQRRAKDMLEVMDT